MKNSTQKQFLTPNEVAKKLQLNPITIYGYIRSKKIIAIKIGRNYRIERNDFESFIESNKLR
jgi:excisionase family DNA binding protein